MKSEEFEFIVEVPPDEETIRNAHKIIAKAYVEKYGVETMKEVLKILKTQQ
jgi:hypothetical protein